MIVFVVVLYGSVEKCAGILGVGYCALCLLLVCHVGQHALFDMWLYIGGYIWRFGVFGLIVFNMVVFIDIWFYVGVGWCVFVVILYGSEKKCMLVF